MRHRNIKEFLFPFLMTLPVFHASWDHLGWGFTILTGMLGEAHKDFTGGVLWNVYHVIYPDWSAWAAVFLVAAAASIVGVFIKNWKWALTLMMFQEMVLFIGFVVGLGMWWFGLGHDFEWTRAARVSFGTSGSFIIHTCVMVIVAVWKEKVTE